MAHVMVNVGETNGGRQDSEKLTECVGSANGAQGQGTTESGRLSVGGANGADKIVLT